MREKKLEALVRVARAPEAGELWHRPEPAAVSRGMNAARVRIFAWHADVRRARPGYVQRRVERIDFAFRIHETDIAELSRGVAAPPLGDLGAQPLELSPRIAVAARLSPSRPQVSRRRHRALLPVFVRRFALRSSSSSATANGFVLPLSSSARRSVSQ